MTGGVLQGPALGVVQLGDARLLIAHQRGGAREPLVCDVTAGSQDALEIDLTGAGRAERCPAVPALPIEDRHDAPLELSRCAPAAGALRVPVDRHRRPPAVQHLFAADSPLPVVSPTLARAGPARPGTA
ncbi:hypothetical protein [Streptomyces sp. ICC4]|uniref:hypothetical protein n=1 Tax=Streptomyces sp. ICC4 TaxID=2099584 RepID=UPI000DC7B7F6|nr:hypothetical protein [Streptomyces sp. ICC4]AWZ09423.1 hypothetical protein DRB89_38800 [Streptomyces sp. ICC4]